MRTVVVFDKLTNVDPALTWLAAVLENDAYEAKDRIDAGIVLLGYFQKWAVQRGNTPASPDIQIVKDIMKTIALDEKTSTSERLRAAAVSL